MSYHHFTILFAIIFLGFGIRALVVTSAYENAADNYNKLERSFYAAADAAGAALCGNDESGFFTDRGAAYDAFVTSMCSSLGILDDLSKREELKNHIVCFTVLSEDGFFMYFEDEYEGTDGYHYLTRNWSETKPYLYSDADFVYRFSLNGDVTLLDRNGLLDGTERMFYFSDRELKEEGSFPLLRAKCPNHFLFREAERKVIKQTAVIESIRKAMCNYINTHNRVTEEYGIAYDFAMPIMDNSLFARSIEHPGVLVMIQGYPIFAARGIYYNQYAFVGAQVTKDEPYYITSDYGWHPTYHRRGCGELLHAPEEVFLTPYYRVEDCVKTGAYACKKCIPDGVYPPETIYPRWGWCLPRQLPR